MDFFKDQEEIKAQLHDLAKSFSMKRLEVYLNKNMEDCVGMLDMVCHRVTLLYFLVGSFKLTGLSMGPTDS